MSKDILLYMSDQHAFGLQGYAGNSVVRTPMLDKLAQTGTAMMNAMTPCPLCVPARASMISGQLPSNHGVLSNFNAISSDQATFLHSLTVSGYETVLCGRMHFVGPDQRHGYSKRVAGERTPVFHNMLPRIVQSGSPEVVGFDENSSVYYMGAGDSPVLAYDRYVVDKAVDYLAQDHDRPQFLTVGTYGPHFPYVAPKELYDYYYDLVPVDDAQIPEQEHPVLKGKMQETDPEVVRASRAAYYGLVEQQDRHIETVYNAFQQYLNRTGREGIFIYISDHGDMNGARGFYGKQVFYEPSVHVPFVIQGHGIPEGQKITSPVSLLDIGPTVCDLAGAETIKGDGKSIARQILNSQQDNDRKVISEMYTYVEDGNSCMGRMVRWNQWKYLTYTGFEDNDMLFNCEQDPEEQLNVITKYPEIAENLRSELAVLKSYDEIMVHENWVIKQLRFLMKCDFDDTTERWQCPSDLETVANPVKSKKPFEMTKWAVRLRAKIEESANN